MHDKKYTRYFEDKHLQALEFSESYEELKVIALEILNNIPKPIGQVCGPISSGGAGSLEKNIEIFQRTIQKLIDEGKTIFNQMPFEKPMQYIRQKSQGPTEVSNTELLEGFYRPIFESGHVTTLYFIHGWESSFGARWEREIATKLKINIVDLPKDFLDN